MKFRKLILQGFKSFVDKTVVEFPDGITCIVGPNGSGKSNILDAIRWVFGEQSPKELRGDSMDDVIFAGSESRKPSGYCEVTLVVSDVPEHIAEKWGTLSEIAITRKYYRTGEREYLINGKKCRLKDIKELFYDTGIGARSISIIEQGKVEKIIQATPEEMRLFFDEVAGITKFKERKKEALSKLSSTKDNLQRLADIISEVEKNRNILESQVNKLNKYKELRAKIELLDKEYYANSYYKLKIEQNDLVDKLNKLKIQHSTLQNKISLMEKDYAKLKSEVSEKRSELRDLSEQFIECSNNIFRLENEIKLLQNNIDSADKRKGSLKSEISELEDRIKDLNNRRDTLIADIKEIEKSKKEVEFHISEKEELLKDFEIKIDNLKDEISILDEEYINNAEILSNKRNQLIKYETEIENYEKSIKSKENERSSFEIEMEEKKQLVTRLIKEIEKINDDIAIIKNEYDSLNNTIENLVNKIKENEKLLSDKNILKNSYEKEIGLILKQIDNYTFGNGTTTKSLKDLQKGFLIDFIKGIDEELLTEFSDVIVFDDKDKEKVFQIISDTDVSLKFTFLSDIEDIEKWLISSQYEKISDKLLSINKIYRKYSDKDHRIILKELRSKLEYLEKEINKVSDEIRSLEETNKQLKSDLTEYETNKNKLFNHYNELKILYEKKNNELETERKLVEKIEKNIDLIEKEKEFLKETIKTKEKSIHELKNEIESFAERLKDIDEKKNDLEEELSFYEERYDSEKEELTEYLIENKRIEESINAKKREQIYIEKDLNSLINQLKNKQDRLTKLLTVDITNWKESLKEKNSLLDKLTKEKMNLITQKERKESEISDLEDQISTHEHSIKKIRAEFEECEKEIYNIEVKLAGLKAKLDNIREKCFETFHRNIDEFYNEYLNEDFSQKKNREIYNKLLAEIEDLGPLNMAAEEEYNSLNERYKFLTDQRADLEKSIESIQKLINEIDEDTVNRFKATFEIVSRNFNDVFKLLFGNGKSELRLTQPDNILETGVEIFVQPIGKKLTNMNLLSGGEKAMTACTLIFAMFLYKPTPFCFLDEVDAPLDDANIDRFLTIVKKLSKDTQFVIITHNQKTMTGADSLYGITMQEPGISKVLSVKLENV
ncbi:AAA family ATPase [Deferribacter thermophilus]|uniref:AAA family ATPase n=1 Tax=Deferribacter thermophilus TaxID=53573 RepID=UPI003C287B56